jgi:predicted RNA-binding Zn-ribbon protein involved in translation (DUF1610 family)
MNTYDRKKAAKGTSQSKAERRSAAEDMVAAFLASGGTVNRLPAEQATEFVCGNCGQAGIIGTTLGKSSRCPKCRELLRR